MQAEPRRRGRVGPQYAGYDSARSRALGPPSAAASTRCPAACGWRVRRSRQRCGARCGGNNGSRFMRATAPHVPLPSPPSPFPSLPVPYLATATAHACLSLSPSAVPSAVRAGARCLLPFKMPRCVVYFTVLWWCVSEARASQQSSSVFSAGSVRWQTWGTSLTRGATGTRHVNGLSRLLRQRVPVLGT